MSGTKKPVRNDFVFPPEVTNMRIRLPEHGYLLAENIGPLSGTSGYANPVLRSQFLSMKSNRLISDNFEEYVHHTNNCYNQILFLNLKPFKIKERTDLRIETFFSGLTGCPNNLYLIVCPVKETLICKENENWSSYVVIP